MKNEIVILHLYGDLLNLYGEYANVLALKRRLTECGFEVSVAGRSIGDESTLQNADVVYVGCGTENNLRICLDHFVGMKDELKDFIESGGFVIATGNSFEMFGNSLDFDGDKKDGAGIFDFSTSMSFKSRDIGDVIADFDGLDSKIVGFINKCSKTDVSRNALFRVEFGPSGIREDGFKYKNFYGSHLIGPLLVKNPYFLNLIAKEICEKHEKDFVPPDKDGYEFKAYFTTLNELEKRAREKGE